MKVLLYVIIPSIILLAILTQIDDDLSDEAVALRDRIPSSAESEAYLYLLGIFAKKGEKPISVGKSLLEEYQNLDVEPTYDITGYPDVKKLPLPKGDAFCKVWNEGCLKTLFSSEIDIGALLSEHRLLVSRSREFLRFDEYTTLSKPTLHEIYPTYNYLTTAERIKMLDAISIYRNGDPAAALEALSLQFSKLRTSMSLQDNLIGKVVFLMNLSDILDIMSIILSNYDARPQLISSLNQSEKSFYIVAAREFAVSYHTFTNLDKHPEMFEVGGNAPGWYTRLLYKPNMTINAIAPIYTRLDQLARLSPSDFATQMESEDDINPSSLKLRNYVGDTLIPISPEFDHYVARFMDFEAKLALFNQLHHFGLNPNDMTNPYYGSEVPKKVDGSLCFSGPLEDARSLRCLKFEI